MQQHLPPLPAIGLGAAGGSLDAELAAPAAKRARSSPTALASPGLMAANSGVWPALPALPALPSGGEALPAFLSGLGTSAGGLPDAAVPVLLPQPVGLPLPLLPLPSMPAATASAPAQPEQPEGIDKLLELAELAAAQYDELQSLELGASSDLDSIGQQLATSAAPSQPPEPASRVAALQEQQAQLTAALAAHAQQHARLTEQLADFRRSVAELLGGLPPQALTPAQLQRQQQQQADAVQQPVKSEPSAEQSHSDQPAAHPFGRMAAASAVLQAVAEQSMATAAAHSGTNASEAAGVPPPHVASLLALIASAAKSAGPASAHLQQIMQHASLLAGARPLA
jgi:hypothetical protein